MAKPKTVSFNKLEDKWFGKAGTDTRQDYEAKLENEIKKEKKGRQYPRFLFSNPQNTKSKGPFVVHCLNPRMIFKVLYHEKYGRVCIPIERWDNCTETEEAKIVREASLWVKGITDVLI